MLPFFEWCEQSALGNMIRGSLWLFPVIESIHLLALALIGGAVILINQDTQTGLDMWNAARPLIIQQLTGSTS